MVNGKNILLRTSEQSNYRGVGLSEMIYSIENRIKHRCNGELSLHVLDLIESTILSGSGPELPMHVVHPYPTRLNPSLSK